MRVVDMRKAIVVIAALVFCPLVARAQTTTTPIVLTSQQAIPTLTNTTPQVYIGTVDCKANKAITFSWDATAALTTTGDIINIVKSPDSNDCNNIGTLTGAGAVSGPAPTQNPTGSQTQGAASDLILGGLDGGLPDGCDNTTTSSASPYKVFYCVQVLTPAQVGITESAISANIEVNFSTGLPTAPVDVQVAAGDGHLKVNWTAGNSSETILNYEVHVIRADDPNPQFVGTGNASPTAPQVNADVNKTDDGKPLEDNVDYNVFVFAKDVYNNLSEPSTAVLGTPIPILDFYGLYRTENGRAGGCGSPGTTTWIAALGLVAALLARRKKKLRNGALLITAFLAFAPKAQAQGYQRPSRFLLVALKVDRYDPKIDSEPGLTSNPYHQIFGDRAPLRWQAEVDWEVWHPYGSILVGVTGGYWQNFGKGLIKATRAQSQDTALLDIIPLGLIATYRFDKLADLWQRFPIIPYAQIGLMRALWISYNGVGDVSPDTSGRGGKGQGWTLGYTTVLGFAVALDAIDPELSREAFQDTGIQRSSVFAEYGWTNLDGFGNNKSLILSDHAWRFGVEMEF
jgi:hypothetical protein